MSAGPVVSDMMDNNAATFVPVYYHLNSLVAGQPWCTTRADFFSLQYTPYLWLDGSYDAGYTYNAWINDLAVEEQATTDVTIDITAFRGGSAVDVTATVCVEAAGTGKDMRVYFVQVLDHFPSTETYYRNAFRQVRTSDVTVAAGACVEVDAAMTLKDVDLAQAGDGGIIVWAQDPLSSAPADTYQGAYVFDPSGITRDGFESGDVSGWD